jgi:hypothetical protein
MKKVAFLVIGALGLWAVRPVSADNWDQSSTVNDDSAANTTNELVHGSFQTHDVDAANTGAPIDQDWYFVSQKPFSSYEVTLDATTPSMNQSTPMFLYLVDSGGSVLGFSDATSSKGFTRSLRFANLTAAAVDTNWVYVLAPACSEAGVSCTAADTYDIRMYETTYHIPRYNNSGTQTTILIVQNPTDLLTSLNIFFRDGSGTLVGQTLTTVAAGGTFVLNTTTVPGVAGTSGSVTIAHDNRYGSLAGKAVAVEPATGFTFDTQMQAHP